MGRRGKEFTLPGKRGPHPVWSRPEAVEALAHLAHRLGRVPALSDLTDEEPSRSWWYRNYPGGWRQEVKDATGKDANPAHGNGVFANPGPGFRDPEIQLRAQMNRSSDSFVRNGIEQEREIGRRRRAASEASERTRRPLPVAVTV